MEVPPGSSPVDAPLASPHVVRRLLLLPHSPQPHGTPEDPPIPDGLDSGLFLSSPVR